MSLKKLLGFEPKYSAKLTYNDLINAESELGRTLFGPIPVGHQREFFEHRKNIWIWHESWVDDTNVMHNLTIRYEVKPEGVFKKIAGQQYEKLEGAELDNFRLAAKSYLNLIKTKLYS
ncbi:hypothetical protein IKF88_01155 [Candidatus Saccharibacteria bacterium]|nr:hypothetical protein [Candidatus Saccharibacteria bacterium]MBR3254324.1 hypothetical protein [Candidatus Saccharibacteria bacterium]